MTQTRTVTDPPAPPQVPLTVPASGSRFESAEAPEAPSADLTDGDEAASPSPWEGIPAELLDGTHSYDTDSAGGCG
jgi:hypothetical protein